MIVDAKAFSEAMNKVSRVLKKSAIPILEEIRVSVKDGVCTLTATDLETWLTARLPVKGDDMSFTFFKTKDVMKACSHFDGELTIELYEQPEKRKMRGDCGSTADSVPRNTTPPPMKTTPALFPLRRIRCSKRMQHSFWRASSVYAMPP